MRVFKRDHTQKADVKEANFSPKSFIKPLNFMFIDIQTQFRKLSFKNSSFGACSANRSIKYMHIQISVE